MAHVPLTNITGVILVGGKSRRMGTDKAFLELDGKPLIERLLAAFAECFSQTILVGNNGQRFSHYDVPVVADIYAGSPLGGIFSGLYHSTTRSIFVASCDLAYPNCSVIRQICSLSNGYDAVVPVLTHGFETLCAVYSKSCQPAIQSMLEKGNHRIFDLYPQISLRSVPYEELANNDQDGRAFLSVNTPDEFIAAKKGMVVMTNEHNQ
jgi:molybdenum cofactor guanylyltransferase